MAAIKLSMEITRIGLNKITKEECNLRVKIA